MTTPITDPLDDFAAEDHDAIRKLAITGAVMLGPVILPSGRRIDPGALNDALEAIREEAR